MRFGLRAIVIAAASLVLFAPQADAGLLGGGTPTYTWQQINQMGKINAHDGHMLRGCNQYPWTYSIHPPAGFNWEVDVYISGPRNTQYATNALMKGADGLNGTRYYRLCNPSAIKGAYTINAVMTLWGDDGRPQSAHLPVVHYTLN